MRTLDRLGREVLAAYRPVGYAGWGLVAKMDVDEAYAPVDPASPAAAGDRRADPRGSAWRPPTLIARQHTRPIRRLAATAEAVAAGNLERPHRGQLERRDRHPGPGVHTG